MRSIWKFTPAMRDYSIVQMPKGARILSVGNKNETLCVWALVETSAPMVERTFRIAGTGHPVNYDVTPEMFVGTAMFESGRLVFHVFDMGES